MHTSQTLRSSHFQYRRIGPGRRQPVAFNAFCASYHEQDRVGVVSPCLEDGILHTAYALLALTTAFYDRQRARGGDFFIYPQHFAVIGADRDRVSTHAGRLDLTPDEAGIGGAWAWLDVWPDANWLTAPGAPAAMLRKIFDHHINRLFWPQNFAPSGFRNQPTPSPDYTEQSAESDLLPDYAHRILKTRLKSVYYYNTSAPTIEISAAKPAAEIVQTSIERLPTEALRTRQQNARPQREAYRQVRVDDFLNDMKACFAV